MLASIGYRRTVQYFSMSGDLAFAATPPDVRKGSAFPEIGKIKRLCLEQRIGGTASSNQKDGGPERHSHSAHQAAEPCKPKPR
jgi:hypothetical protein